MSSQEIISIVSTVGFLIIVVCAIFITFYLIKALQSLKTLADSLQNTTEKIKEKIQINILKFVPAIVVGLIGRLLKRGR